ncbi:DUF4418 family protein [uncultured Mobiluncus sp.]|uniref:DUF4418 family protein n=1 Tax=uncultured Mobiluncus sp. TaxID=293425 RepID=UPI00262C5E83|nr:DUF4418 family protein [uncultured Mobiluncus sp.]
MKDRIIGSLPTIVLGLLIAIAPRTFAPVCEFAAKHSSGMEHMSGMKGSGGMENMDHMDHMGQAGKAMGEAHQHMACYWTAQASLGIGILLLVIGLIAFFVNAQIRTGLNISAALIYVLEILIVTVLIGVCKNEEMSCNVYAMPTLLALSCIGILAVGAAIFLDQKKRPVAQKATA